MLKSHSFGRRGFTLIEIMIVVATIALLASVATPSALRARKRTQAHLTIDTCRQLDAACDQWATENSKSSGDVPAPQQLALYLKSGSRLRAELMAGIATDGMGTELALPAADVPPKVAESTVSALSDVVDPDSFWGAYRR